MQTMKSSRMLHAMSVVLLLAWAGAAAAEFRCNACKVKASDVARCRAIDPDRYSTGQLFNPPGMKTSYKQSVCLQHVATKYRDPDLCAAVRERKSLFFDGSAISADKCRANVAEAARKDPPVDIRGIYRLSQLQFYRNGNGRDVDIHITMAGAYRHTYALRTVLLSQGTDAVMGVLEEQDRYVGPNATRIRVFLRRARIDTAAHALGIQPPYVIRVTLALVEPGIAEVPAFAALTPAQRESRIDTVVDLDALKREPVRRSW